MTLPHASAGVIERPKVEDYLLSATHPVGRFKAVFFRALGFTALGWSDLRDALLTIGRDGVATELPPSAFG